MDEGGNALVFCHCAGRGPGGAATEAQYSGFPHYLNGYRLRNS